LKLLKITRFDRFPLPAAHLQSSKAKVSAQPDCPDSGAGLAPLLPPYEPVPTPSNYLPPSVASPSVLFSEELEEAELVQQFDIEGAAAHEVLGFDDDEDYEDEELGDSDEVYEDPVDLDSP